MAEYIQGTMRYVLPGEPITEFVDKYIHEKVHEICDITAAAEIRGKRGHTMIIDDMICDFIMPRPKIPTSESLMNFL